MSKEIYISSTPHETRLAIVENDALTEIYYERENEYTLAGSIYNGRVTRVLPGMQSSFVDIGLERDAFLYITDFMEEAGDSADFEASANAGDHSRAPRSSDRTDRNDRGDRNGRDRNASSGSRADRPDQPRQPERAAEPSDAELFTQAVSGLDPARPVLEGERSDRGGSRRGGRNRRDRNFNSDGTPRRDRPEAPRQDAPRQEFRAEQPRSDQPRAEAPVDLAPDATLSQTEQLGEAAPGADGSRRWRGRRGRRGNRGREDFAQRSTLDAEPGAESTHSPVPAYAEPAEPAAVAPAEIIERAPRGDRPERSTDRPDFRSDRSVDRDAHPDRSEGRRDRGDRGDRNRRDRGQQLPPRVPRGFAPSLSLYKVDAISDETPYGQEPEFAAPIEPIILPGESLSKYRTGSAEPAPSVSHSTPLPTADFVLPGAWDGGFVLPGETLRRRESSTTSEPSRRADRDDRSGRDLPRHDERGSRDRDRGRDPDRGSSNERTDRQDHAPYSDREASAFRPRPELTASIEDQSGSASHAVDPVHSTFVAPPPVPIQSEIHPGFVPPHEAPETFAADHNPPHLESLPSDQSDAPAELTPASREAVAAEPNETATLARSEAPPAEDRDFEPTEASASFRVDPIPPREFRQPSPVLEPASFADAEAAVDLSPATPAFEAHAETLEAGAGANDSDPADLHTVSPELRHAFESRELETPHFNAPELASPELTSINDSGEMHSEPAGESAPGSHLPEIDRPEPDSPIEHEFAIVDSSNPDHLQPEAPVRSEAVAPRLTPEAGFFAPGDGHLEEEEFVDDEEILPSLRASAFQDQESLRDQETLEGAADLGTMIREMSIDHITRTEPAAIDTDEDDDYEEDDLEEDFLEEDQLEDDQALATGSDYADDEGGEEEESGEPLDETEGSAYASDDSHPAPAGEAAAQPDSREPRREGRRDERGRRDGRRGDRNRRDRGDRKDRAEGGFSSPAADSTDRPRSDSRDSRDSRGGRNSRQSMQSTNLPAISDLLKPGQELLCQIAKEPIAKKGARITSHIALPGRFLVFMPTVHHTGVSRKIESDAERRRLKEILISERGEATGGFIVRTAAAGASEEELRSDLRFLLNLWADIKTRSESSKSPALIYHDLNLVERVLRDQVTDNFSAIWVDTETEYERVLRFLQRFQPSLIRRVKLYTKETPLFEQFGITEEINKALRSKVWLKSGGSIVINQTEALVAIDINTGKFVGKTARLEDTIVKTNLDAIPEIVRQIRLRDLGGIIIIDFIDMDERKNRNKVMAALEEELKSDRAPSKVLQFNDFGLVAITRKRVKQSLERTLSTTCGVCQGTGMVKSPVSVCNDIYIEMRKMHKHLDRGDVMLRVHPDVVKQLKSTTKWLQEMEEMVGKTILVKSDPSLHPEQFDIH
jgi:ribonuclease G